jgi:hypothetical protein
LVIADLGGILRQSLLTREMESSFCFRKNAVTAFNAQEQSVYTASPVPVIREDVVF